MRYETRAYGTRDEIEAELKNAYEAPGRSERRKREAEEAGIAFLSGERYIQVGKELMYVIEGPVYGEAEGPSEVTGG